MLEVIPVPPSNSLIALLMALGVSTATSGSPICRSEPLVMKYFIWSSVLPITKVFGLIGVSLSEAINAGTISPFPLATTELAPPETAQVAVANNETAAKNTANTEAKWARPSFEFFSFGITFVAT